MTERECLHAPPKHGQSASPCCGRTLEQLPRYDRITLTPEQVTCGRLSSSDILLLSGQPVIADPDHERTTYLMATTVCVLSGGSLTLQAAHDMVNTAIRQVLPPGQVLDRWSAALMISVTERAQELARQ